MKLLIVDPQDIFLTKSNADDILSITPEFNEIICTKFIEGNSLFETELGFTAKNESLEICERIKSESDKIFEKRGYNALQNDNFRDYIQSDISKIYVCGFETDACVMSTVLSIFDYEVRPIVIEDLCWTENTHTNIMDTLKRNIGVRNVITSEQF